MVIIRHSTPASKTFDHLFKSSLVAKLALLKGGRVGSHMENAVSPSRVSHDPVSPIEGNKKLNHPLLAVPSARQPEPKPSLTIRENSSWETSARAATQLTVMTAGSALLTGCISMDMVDPTAMDLSLTSPELFALVSLVYLSVNLAILAAGAEEFKGKVLHGNSWNRLLYLSALVISLAGVYGCYHGFVDFAPYINDGIFDGSIIFSRLTGSIVEGASLAFATAIATLPLWSANILLQNIVSAMSKGSKWSEYISATTLEYKHFLAFKSFLENDPENKQVYQKMLTLLESPAESHWQVPIYIKEIGNLLIEHILNDSIDSRAKFHPSLMLIDLLKKYPGDVVGLGAEKLRETCQYLLDSENLDLQAAGNPMKTALDPITESIDEEMSEPAQQMDELLARATDATSTGSEAAAKRSAAERARAAGAVKTGN